MSTLENSITPTISHNTIEARVLDSSMTYAAYIENVNALIAQGKASTNDASNDEEHLHFTQLNQSRMKRLDKTTHLSSETVAALSNWKTPVYFLVFNQRWSRYSYYFNRQTRRWNCSWKIWTAPR